MTPRSRYSRNTPRKGNSNREVGLFHGFSKGLN